MSGQKVYRAIGLMSGTSLDGEIDVALIRTDGQSFVEALDFKPFPYDRGVREKVRACFGQRAPDAQTLEAEALVTDLHSAAVKASGFQADVIGFHGQTITHDPAKRFTWQLGDGARLARETGMDVVYDFRSADVKAGGQGAPLIPLFHAAMMAGQSKPVAVLNLGGVGNVTFVGDDEDILAFDTGPANALLDDFVRQRTGKDFDAGGALAAQGKPDARILKTFLSDPFFDRPAPKSLDRNHWSLDVVKPLSAEDGAATLLAMSVGAVVRALEHLPAKPKAVYVCGGGRKNEFMMDQLRAGLGLPVQAIDTLGWNGDAIEAQGFGYLAVRSLLGLPLSLPSTTGVPDPISGGVLCKA